MPFVAAAVWIGAAGSARAVTGTPPVARGAALYNLRASPFASFVWFPMYPAVGERFLLVSVSTDRASAISAYAWDVTDDGPFGAFQPGGPSTTAAFSTPARHVVRLRVTSADHLSSTATKSIPMSAPPAGVLRPFPDVRLSGRLTRSGVWLSRVSVRAPAHSQIGIVCRGAGCRARPVSKRSAGLAGHAAWTTFHVLERFLPAGATLQIRVSGGGKIGAYTRFTARWHKLPVRVDSCLDPRGVTPIICPST
jgi:hypothetical protein